MTHSLKASHLFGIDVDDVAGLGLLVAAYRLGGLQVLDPAKPYCLEHSTNGGERRWQQLDDATERTALMTELDEALQLQWIDRPPLGAANIAPIHQSRGTT